MATIVPFSKEERDAIKEAERAKPIIVVEMNEDQRKGMLVALSFFAMQEAKNGNVDYANEVLDYNRILNTGKLKEPK